MYLSCAGGDSSLVATQAVEVNLIVHSCVFLSYSSQFYLYGISVTESILYLSYYFDLTRLEDSKQNIKIPDRSLL